MTSQLLLNLRHRSATPKSCPATDPADSFLALQQRTLADAVARLLDARLARAGRLKRDAHRAGITPGELLSVELLATLAPLLPLPGTPWGTN